MKNIIGCSSSTSRDNHVDSEALAEALWEEGEGIICTSRLDVGISACVRWCPAMQYWDLYPGKLSRLSCILVFEARF